MGEGRHPIKVWIVASLLGNTTATRERPVPARKKQPADAPAPPSKGRKRAAPADGADKPAPARRGRKPATAALPDAGGGSKQSLVIVESPAKARTINKYLGPGFTVLASMGHVRD